VVDGRPAVRALYGSRMSWSFDAEWQAFNDLKVERTWGWTVEQRIQQFLLEVGLEEHQIRGLRILDAGCGNGLLTNAIAGLGATVVGVDASSSVEEAEKRKTLDNVSFMCADLRNLPFGEEFDLIYSTGVLHHNPSTRDAFLRLARHVKPEGRMYAWVYRPPVGLRNRIFRIREAILRPFMSRLPSRLQRVTVQANVSILYPLQKLLGRRSISRAEMVVGTYDSLTPKYAHRHIPQEMASWFHDAGFQSPTLSHWNNPNGFGMVAVKKQMEKTPGTNF
jgi:SAM-dependent methyltransferase